MKWTQYTKKTVSCRRTTTTNSARESNELVNGMQWDVGKIEMI